MDDELVLTRNPHETLRSFPVVQTTNFNPKFTQNFNLSIFVVFLSVMPDRYACAALVKGTARMSMVVLRGS